MKNHFLTQAALLAAVATVGCALAQPASAVPVSYTVGGVAAQSFPGPVTPPANAPHVLDGLGYPGDTVEIQSFMGMLDLTPGTVVQKVNTLLWSISYTYAGTADDPNAWSDLNFTVNATRSIDINGVSGILTQPGSLKVTWENDFLKFLNGPTLTLSVDGFDVAITLLAISAEGTNFPGFPGGTPWTQPAQNMLARFDITASEVPVPAALPLLASGLGALGLAGWRRKRSRAA